MQHGNLRLASDAFSIGLTAVLLRLCKPLLKPSYKVLVVDPSYCAVFDEDCKKCGVHMKHIYKETCLIPLEVSEVRITADKYNFITECFFMTHKAIDLGYRVCIEKFMKLYREVHRMRSMYDSSVAQHGAERSENILRLVKMTTQQFLSFQFLLMEPTNDTLLVQFYEATCIWLGQLTAANNFLSCTPQTGYAPQIIREFTLPIATNNDFKLLKVIPEFVIENMINYLTYLAILQQAETTALDTDIEAQSAIFTMILIFMGSSERVRNPHLRARLAEGLESLLPKAKRFSAYRNTFRTNIFNTHPFRLEVAPNLLRVFVDIETTGQSVQFEQKFNYRRPMYAIMDYLWSIEEHKNCFK